MTQPAILDQIAQTTLYWEDLAPGMTYSTSSRTITEADVAAFAALTGDFNKVHVDAEYAKGTIFGQRIAHGMLVASFMAGLTSRSIPNQFFEGSLFSVLENRLKFPKPTFIGDTIRVDIEVTERPEESSPEDRWAAADEAVKSLEDYDFDAWAEGRAYDAEHGEDHLR